MTASLSPADRPNILLLHWHDVGTHLRIYGVDSAACPNVESLAGQGTRFENAYCTTPLCSPARASMMTGLYPHTNGVDGLAHRGHGYRDGTTLLTTLLSGAGYDTALFGVQHEALDPKTLGYDEMHNVGEGEQFAPLVAEATEEWLAARADLDRPFFASVGFIETHRPYPASRYDYSDPATVTVPPWLPDNEWTRDDLAAFEGSIRVADAGVGRVMAALDAAGLADTTWLIFTTDHGPAFPGGKSSLYEPGVRVAMVQRFPRSWGVPEGVTDRLFSHVDLVPTLLDAIGADVPDGLHGISHAAWVRGEPSAPAREAVFTEKTFHNSYDPTRAVRIGDWKLIRSWEERPRLVLPPDMDRATTRYGIGDDHLRHRPPVELYNLAEDPQELVNLADDEGHAATVAGMLARLERWQVDTADPILAGPYAAPPWPRLLKFGAIGGEDRP